MDDIKYLCHLANDKKPKATACGEPWQGWQAPKDLDLYSFSYILSPHNPPRPHVDKIRLCQACAKWRIE